MKRHETILHRDNTALIVIDYQQKLVDVMHHRTHVTAEILRIIQAMKMLNVPIIATEQYPQGLGPTVPEVAELLDSNYLSQKMTFSCCGINPFAQTLQNLNRRQLILTGIETHVCVLQTALDLLANGYQVHIPTAATCSRSDSNRDNALNRMQEAGAILTNTESVFFELLTEAGTEDFKKVRKLVV